MRNKGLIGVFIIIVATIALLTISPVVALIVCALGVLGFGVGVAIDSLTHGEPRQRAKVKTSHPPRSAER